MTPMIDVTFQLIIFFMLVTEFTNAQIEKLQLPQAHNPQKTKMDDPTILIINVLKDGTIRIGGKTYYDARKGEKEGMAFTLIEKLFESRRMSERHQEVRGRPDFVKYFMMIRADRDADFEHVQRLLMMATRYGGVTKVMFAAIKEQS